MICKYFLPFCWLSFHFLTNALWCTKVSNFDTVQFIFFFSFVTQAFGVRSDHCILNYTLDFLFCFFFPLHLPSSNILHNVVRLAHLPSIRTGIFAHFTLSCVPCAQNRAWHTVGAELLFVQWMSEAWWRKNIDIFLKKSFAGTLGQWNYSVGPYNSGYVLLHTHPNPRNIHQIVTVVTKWRKLPLWDRGCMGKLPSALFCCEAKQAGKIFLNSSILPLNIWF